MKFLFIILLFPFQLFAQDITGVWVGNMYNDTTKEYIHYELAITELKEKLTGYSHTTFIVDSVENIGVKSVKITKKKDELWVEDEKLINNNYPEPPVKGIKTLFTLFYSKNDSLEVLKGTWKTNITRKYNQFTGSVYLEKKKKIKETLIVTRLGQLGLADKLSFAFPENLLANIQQRKEPRVKAPAENNKGEANKIGINKISPDTTITDPEIVIVAVNKKSQPEDQKKIIAEDTKKSEILINNPGESIKQIEDSKSIIKIPPAAEIANRKIETIQIFEIKQDSLVLSLYDNGTVDGDTVSILMNGKVIWPKVGLLATAANKTIYLTPEMGDSVSIIMYAETLGSIPPNTGLLVVRDGEKNYEIRFSGDLQKNSAIILKRKKKE